MVVNTNENNIVTVSGKVSAEPKFSHEVYGEGFYFFNLDVPRLSDSCDVIPITISERLILDQEIEIGKNVTVDGQFRSHNSYDGKKNKLILTVFAREIVFHQEEVNNNPNQIYLNGFVCKKPIFRTTPFGREIADILLAVNRPYSKADYIPCISWGRNAKYSESLEVGSNLKIWGRIQSREYQKTSNTGETVKRMAYEVSVTKMEICDKSEQESEEKRNKEEENKEE